MELFSEQVPAISRTVPPFSAAALGGGRARSCRPSSLRPSNYRLFGRQGALRARGAVYVGSCSPARRPRGCRDARSRGSAAPVGIPMVTAGRPRAVRVGARRAVSTGRTPRTPLEGRAPFSGEERVPAGASSIPISFIVGAPALRPPPGKGLRRGPPRGSAGPRCAAGGLRRGPLGTWLEVRLRAALPRVPARHVLCLAPRPSGTTVPGLFGGCFPT